MNDEATDGRMSDGGRQGLWTHEDTDDQQLVMESSMTWESVMDSLVAESVMLESPISHRLSAGVLDCRLRDVVTDDLENQ